MMIYISHKFGGDFSNLLQAKQITHDLQIADPENCYICPLMAFSHLRYGEMSYDAELELCIDLLSVCDKLIVASIGESEGVRREVEFAEKVGMEVEFLL